MGFRYYFFAVHLAIAFLGCHKKDGVSKSVSTSVSKSLDSLFYYGIKQDFEKSNQFVLWQILPKETPDSTLAKVLKYSLRSFTYSQSIKNGEEWMHKFGTDLYKRVIIDTSKCEIHFILGEYYDALGQPFNAINLYQKALNCHKTFKTLSKKIERLSFDYLGLNYFITGNLRLAEDYFSEEIPLTKEIFGSKSDDYVSNLNNMSILKRYRGDYKTSLKLIDEAIAIRLHQGVSDPNRIANLYENKAKALSVIGQKNEAMKVVTNAEKLRISIKNPDTTHLSSTLIAKGDILLSMGRKVQALNCYRQALSICKRSLGENDENTVDCYEKVANFWASSFNNDSTEYYASKLLTAEKFKIQDFTIPQIRNPDRILSALYFIAASSYRKPAKSVVDIKKVLSASNLILKSVLKQYHTIATIKEVNDRNLNVINGLIRIGAELYKTTQDPDFFSFAFEMIEQSKSLELYLQSIANIQLYNKLPDKIAQEEYELKNKIDNLKEALFAHEHGEIKDSLLRQLAKFNTKYEGLEHEISSKYRPANRFYTGEKFNLLQIQKLLGQRNEALYQIYADTLNYYILSILPNQKPNISSFDKQSCNKILFDFYKILSNPNTEEDSGKEAWESTSIRISQMLLGNSRPSNSRLLILPASAWFIVPYDALCFDPSMGEPNTFLEKYEIEIAYSFGQWTQLQTKSNIKIPSQVLYSSPFVQSGGVCNLDNKSIKVDAIPCTNNEVNALKSSFDNVQELNFKRNEKLNIEANILHLGLHAYSDELQYKNSMLLFKDKHGVFPIKASEIYNSKIQTQLAVLSACETGIGKIDESEGCLSLARAFFYAGSKAVASTLWKVNDAQSSVVIGYFYQNLSNGMSKTKALREAKSRYLSEAREHHRHPFYWAGLTLYGNTDPLKLNSKPLNFKWTGLGLLVILVLLIKKKVLNS